MATLMDFLATLRPEDCKPGTQVGFTDSTGREIVLTFGVHERVDPDDFSRYRIPVGISGVARDEVLPEPL